MSDNLHSIKGLSNKCVMLILDGFGINPNRNRNAIFDAKKPHLDYYFNHFPFTTIEAGGELVGLPKGVAGNSEVGHMNLGAGRSVRQDLVCINESIANGTFSTRPKLVELIEHAKRETKRIHLIGLLSDGGVHSHINHLKEILNTLLKNQDLEIFLHAFMDGRDTARDCGIKYIKELEPYFNKKNFHFSSMQGRSIGMDRDRRWEKIKLCYSTIIGQGPLTNLSPKEYLADQYSKNLYDEFVTPTLFNYDFRLQQNDSMFFFNFRPDRAIQLSLALNWNQFKEFQVPIKPSYFLCMTPYIPDEVELPILFDKEKISGGLTAILANKNLRQFKIAETEKYAHVTYFFNGGEKKPFPNEEHCLIPSPKDVPTYDKKPEMSAPKVTDKLLSVLENTAQFDFYLVNFANSDMVGHTGNYDAAVSAIETLDQQVYKIVNAANAQNIPVLITADHGNSDEMVYPDGTPHTSHTAAPVPVCLIHPKLKDQSSSLLNNQQGMALKDVAPTILNILGIEIPDYFTGKSIFK